MIQICWKILRFRQTLNWVHSVKVVCLPYSVVFLSPPQRQKAKVVAAVWGKEFIQFLAALAILPIRTILKTRMNSSFSFKSSCCYSSYYSNRPLQNSQRGKELNNFCLPNKSNDLCLFFCLYPSSMTAALKASYLPNWGSDSSVAPSHDPEVGPLSPSR